MPSLKPQLPAHSLSSGSPPGGSPSGGSPSGGSPKNISPEIQGVFWMLASCVWFSIMATLVRLLAQDMEAFSIVFFRNVFALMLMLPWVMRHGKSALHTTKLPLHILRGCTGVIGMLLFFSALVQIPITQAVSLSFTVPLFTTIAAIFFLKEKVGWHRWGALIVGFSGTLIILRPGAGDFQLASLLVIAATVTWALSNVVIKKLTKTEYPQTMVFYMTLLMTPLSLPFALLEWQVPVGIQFVYLFGLGAVSNLAQLCLFRAYAKTDVSVVLPADFSRLIFTSILGYIFFAEILDMWTALGAMVILASTIYISRRESRIRKAA